MPGLKVVAFLLALCWLGSVGECRSSMTLASGGVSDMVIVQAAQPTEAEVFAAKELAEYIRRSSGATLPIVPEGERKEGARGIFVGQTEFAARQKVDFTKLGGEEWLVRGVKGNLMIAGGRPRGTLYGVYEFLEKGIGVRFLSADAEFVPAKPMLTIPADLAIQGAPAFTRREIAMVGGGCGSDKFLLFQIRRKINSFANADRSVDAKFGYAVRFGSPYSTHTHTFYAQHLPADKPEYFAMLESGGRVGRPEPGARSWDGQVCMSNPEVRKLFAAQLREYIRQDREKAAKSGTGEPCPTLYSLVPSDNTNKCVCPNCLALAKKYGAYTGVVLEFTNAIAEDIARDYPEIRITTSAYTFYADPPVGIKPRDNVVIYVAQLGAEFSTPVKRDTLRGTMQPINVMARQMFEGWAKIGGAFGVHDYWTAWNQSYLWPQANVHGTAQTLRAYHRWGVRQFLVEDELFGSRLHNFVDLQFYVGAEMLQDPKQDEEALIAEFMDLYYGPAAPAMKKLLAYVERRQEEEPGMLAAVPPDERKYFDRAFFTETDALIGEAERSAADDPRRLADVRQERLAIDETMLYLWDSLSGTPPLPFKREEILARLRENYEAAYRKYGGWGVALKQLDDARLEYLRTMPPIPAQFKGRKIIDLCGPQLNLRDQFPKHVEDPDAVLGKAWRLDSSASGAPGQHDQPVKFGLYDNVSKECITQVIPQEKVAQDEKYHLLLGGRIKGSPNLYFWAHHSWRLCQRLNMTYNAALPEQKRYEIYASIKLEGPAYVPGSVKPNSFSVDRLILVEVADAQ